MRAISTSAGAEIQLQNRNDMLTEAKERGLGAFHGVDPIYNLFYRVGMCGPLGCYSFIASLC